MQRQSVVCGSVASRWRFTDLSDIRLGDTGVMMGHEFRDLPYNKTPGLFQKWLGVGVSYRQEPSAAERAAIANETGIAVFDWSTVHGSIPGSSADAAKALQAFIDRTGLKDVTIVGHSKGAIAATELLAMYQNGELDKGAVKNMVLIDPPQNAGIVRFFGGSARPVDATKAGVNVVFLPGQVCSFFGPPRGTSQIENDIEFPYVDNHGIRGDSANSVFDTLRNRAQ